jgi:hypothetical protein
VSAARIQSSALFNRQVRSISADSPKCNEGVLIEFIEATDEISVTTSPVKEDGRNSDRDRSFRDFIVATRQVGERPDLPT